MIEWLNDWMIEWLNDWMIYKIEWLNDWMIEWFIKLNDWMIEWNTLMGIDNWLITIINGVIDTTSVFAKIPGARVISTEYTNSRASTSSVIIYSLV